VVQIGWEAPEALTEVVLGQVPMGGLAETTRLRGGWKAQTGC